ncbi:restriction modification system DNA specificity domain protein [Sphaerospermopsis reniformis]|uniref:Restriction modification system DNA specificity domain protein n=1 Tax=Sphaerospermopsis reniformis TaxID=531300 RepID=A0A479ZVQ2_9CYAN|nr:restriction endonuclease subunit S [Sphaerospermopsis reniformis]GCL35358.1 restriction modification system DNA specificity domain protein [Sphaerospermopsis reniformis]
MREGWEVKTLGSLCDFIRGPFGGSLKKSCFKSSGYAVYEQQHAIYNQFKEIRYFINESKYQEMKRFEIFPGDLIMSCSGTMGKVAIVPDGIHKGIINQALLKLAPRQDINANFLKYWMSSPNFQNQILNLSMGVAIKNVASVKVLKEILINLPPLPEQKRIVAILDEAFEGIDRAISNTEKNLSNARELFESYLNSIFSQKGEGWEEKKLEDVCSITSKLVDPRQPEFIDLPHIGAGNMISMTGELIEVKTARQEQLISGKFLFDETMVLYSKIRPYLMKACRPDFSGLCSADVYPLLPNNEELNRDFLFYILMSRDFTNYAISGSDRAGMPKVNRDHLFRYSTWIPSISDQINIAQKIDELFTETQRLENIYLQKIAALKELKQSILQKAFAGELTADNSKTEKGQVAA